MGITKQKFEVETWDKDSKRSSHHIVYLHPTREVYGDMELWSVFAKRLGVDEDDVLAYLELPQD